MIRPARDLGGIGYGQHPVRAAVEHLARGPHDPRATVETVFDLLVNGWQAQPAPGNRRSTEAVPPAG